MTDNLPDDQLTQAARAFFPDATTITPLPGHADLVRVEAASGEWRVRRWPADVAPERIRFIHDLLDAAASASLLFTPRLHRTPDGALVRLDDRAFDATSWLPGRTAVRHQPSVGSIGESLHVPAPMSRATQADLTARVAELHAALVPLSHRADAPAVTLHGIEHAVRASWQTNRERLRPVATRTPLVQRWLRTAERALPAAEQVLSGASSAFHERQVVGHFGLWPAHVIVRRSAGEERVAGLIDFARAAVGPPVLDLAQAVTRFGGWSPESVEQVTGAYSAVTDLPPEDRRLLPAVAALDLTAEIGRLLTATFATERPDAAPAPSSLRAGMDTLLTSLEAATAALIRLEGPDRPPRRQWVPGRRKPPATKPVRRDRRRKNR
ncbi:MAG: phosphotransferase enzyme family protein [Thermomicrobiales bacterium]